jgi:hypothetical protein
MNRQSKLTAVADNRHGKKNTLLNKPAKRRTSKRIFATRNAKGICSMNDPNANTKVFAIALMK